MNELRLETINILGDSDLDGALGLLSSYMSDNSINNIFDNPQTMDMVDYMLKYLTKAGSE